MLFFVSTIYEMFVMYVFHIEYEINPYPKIQLLIESQLCLKIQENVLDRGAKRCCEIRRSVDEDPERRDIFLELYIELTVSLTIRDNCIKGHLPMR